MLSESAHLTEADYNRIYWASRRGMLELDLVLMPFAEKPLRELAPADQQRYIRLLESEDTELFAWFLQRQRPQDPELAAIVDIVLAYATRAAR